ncbi:helix-turn-helix transcriptional regulator [Rhodopila globiformis]|uniref:Helix-turn-helix domain-containing protein n=1 Tax=Rhodopila globiformis TaxID=1071 RepID=A0A2S6N7H6_RHOGL|nr:helix-turn-helix domain-containing protein [Rhodopila globiformis]PPQ30575.1 hypothetical protein CCS01_18865 [Rhodopila globiformis]
MAEVVLLTKKMVAARLGCTERTIDNLLNSGDGPPSIKIGGLRRIPAAEFEAWIAAKLAAARRPAATPDAG